MDILNRIWLLESRCVCVRTERFVQWISVTVYFYIYLQHRPYVVEAHGRIWRESHIVLPQGKMHVL